MISGKLSVCHCEVVEARRDPSLRRRPGVIIVESFPSWQDGSGSGRRQIETGTDWQIEMVRNGTVLIGLSVLIENVARTRAALCRVRCSASGSRLPSQVKKQSRAGTPSRTLSGVGCLFWTLRSLFVFEYPTRVREAGWMRAGMAHRDRPADRVRKEARSGSKAFPKPWRVSWRD